MILRQTRRDWLRLLSLAGLTCTSSISAFGKTFKNPPNILFIFIDDMGWPAISCYGNRHVRTENVDRLAREGIQFTDAYVTPQCTPSRASLLTGQHTARNGMWHVIPRYYYPFARIEEPRFVENLPRGTHTIAKALQQHGYRTAHIGKWHLTQNEDGYYTYLKDAAKHHYGFDYVNPMTDPTEYQGRGDKGVNLLTDEAIGFMERNQDNPFFIYLSHHTIHGPVLAPEDTVNRYRSVGYPKEGIHSAVYLAAIEHLDRSIGKLLSRLDELDLAENTVVFFLSDNGGVDSLFDNSPLRAGKGSIYEGGIRVPLIVRWPRKIQERSVSSTPVQIVDIYPTLLEIAGAELPTNHILDGRSLVPLLKGQETDQENNLYWFAPLYDKRWGLTPCAAIRKEDYKLIHFFGDYVDLENGRRYIPEGRVELFNLREDLSETQDLSKNLPKIRENLLKELHQWIASTGNSIPELNPDFDINRWFEEAR